MGRGWAGRASTFDVLPRLGNWVKLAVISPALTNPLAHGHNEFAS